MKHLFSFLALIALVALCATPMHQVALAAGDTLVVLATPPGNINNVINGDTLTGGLRAHPDRVYKLRRGNVYQVTEPIKVNGSIRIVANDTTAGLRPPVLAPGILLDNSSVDHFFNFIGKGATVEMTNLYLLSVRSDQNWLGWSDGIRINADSVKIKLRSVVFDGWSDAGIRIDAHWTRMDVQDCMFRNHQHSSSWFGGQPFMTGSPIALDTVKFINNSFFANNSYLWSIRGYDVKSIFEHNTLVYGTVNPFLTRQGSHLFIKNNLFYAMHAMGGNPDHVWGGWFLNYPDTTSSGIVQIRSKMTWQAIETTGPEVYVDSAHGVYAPMVAASNRSLDLRNNYWYLPTTLTGFYQAYNDTTTKFDSLDYQQYGLGQKGWIKRILVSPTWINQMSGKVVDSVIVAQGGTVINSGNNLNTDPGFGSTVTPHMAKLIAYVNKISTGTLDSTWHYKGTSGVLYPPTWPLPENLAYTNTAMQTAGSDGFPIGDLNWFPAKKAQWLLTDVRPVDNIVPDAFTLDQNYPNPFNPTTQITFSLKSNEQVSLVVYNMLGQQVRTLVNGQEMAAGSYSATWNGLDDRGFQMASGAYVYRLQTKSFSMTRTMMLLK